MSGCPPRDGHAVPAFGVEPWSIRDQLEFLRQLEAAVGATWKIDHGWDCLEWDRPIAMRERFAVGDFVTQAISQALGIDAQQDEP